MGHQKSLIFECYERNYRRNTQKTDIARKLPFIRKYAESKIQNYFNLKHAGQVISLEDAISICSIPGKVSVIDCPCQKYLFNRYEKKCILFGTTADIVENLPNFNIKDMDFEDAAELLKSTESKGQIHTVWTFISPYVGAICNCKERGCLLFHLKNKYPFADIVRKGHEIAIVDHNICAGCGDCQKICQFNAVTIKGRKAEINDNCYGCGVCRNFCSLDAIQLVPYRI